MSKKMQSRRKLKQYLLISAMAAIIMLGFWLGLMQRTHKQESVEHQWTTLKPSQPLPHFYGTNGQAQAITDQSLVGQPHILFFGYTRCGTLCPSTLSTIAQAYHQLRQHGAKVPPLVVISLDPEFDQPARLQQYAVSFDPDFSGWNLPPQQLQHLIKFFGIVRQASTQANNPIDHSAQIILLDAQGRWQGLISAPFHSEALADIFSKTVVG